MASFQINTREIRSFKLYKQTLDIRSFFEDQNKNGIFMMCDSLNPNERIAMRADLSANNLKINILPKNTTRFLFNSEEKKYIKNLLNGNVVLIKNATENPLNETQLKFLIQQEKMTIRFLFWKGQVYRGDAIKKFVALPEQEKNKKELIKTINKPLYNLLNICMPFTLKSNYNYINIPI